MRRPVRLGLLAAAILAAAAGCQSSTPPSVTRPAQGQGAKEAPAPKGVGPIQRPAVPPP